MSLSRQTIEHQGIAPNQVGELVLQKSKVKQPVSEKRPLTHGQHQNEDALELAKIIYDIYNDSCPVLSLNESADGNSDV